MGQKLQGYKGLFYFAAGSASVVTNSTTTSGNKTLVVDSVEGIADGDTVAGTGIGVAAVVTQVDASTNTVTVSVNSTATGSAVAVTFTRAASKVKLAHCAGWDMDIKADSVDATDHDTVGWKDFLDGLREFSGTIDAMYFTGDQTQFDLIDAMLSGSIDVVAEFRPLDKSGETSYTGTIRLNGAKLAAKGSTAQAINLSYQGRGALTRTVIA